MVVIINISSYGYLISFSKTNLIRNRATFIDPCKAMIEKMKANEYVRIKLPSYNNIFDGFMPDFPSVPGIYISPIMVKEKPILGFSENTKIVESNNLKWQLDALSNLSLEHARVLGLTACRSLLPSIISAGLFSLKYNLDYVVKDENYVPNVYRAVFTITCKRYHRRIDI